MRSNGPDVERVDESLLGISSSKCRVQAGESVIDLFARSPARASAFVRPFEPFRTFMMVGGAAENGFREVEKGRR